MRTTIAVLGLWLVVLGAWAQPATKVRSLDNLLDRAPIKNEIVLVETGLGTNDWGGIREFKHDTAWAGGTNTGNAFAARNSGYWVAADRTAPAQDVRWWGAVGDGVTDDTAAIQAAADYCASFTNNRPWLNLAGRHYIVSNTITLRGVSMYGSPAAVKPNSRLVRGNSAILEEAIGSTTPAMLLCTFNEYVGGKPINESPTIAGITFLGHAEANPPAALKTLTGSTSRTNFSVAAADFPTNTPSTSVPYYGWAFFWTPDDKFIGNGMVATGNTGTGNFTLLPGTDNYATTNGTTTLTAGYKVAFSQYSTVTNYAGSVLSGWSAAKAGRAAIVFEAASNPQVKDCHIYKFHAGIVTYVTDGLVVDRVQIEGFHYAGIAGAYAPYDTDWHLPYAQLYGNYREEYADGFVNLVGTWDNTQMRGCVAAIDNLGAQSWGGHLVVGGGAHGVIGGIPNGSTIHDIVVETTYREPIWVPRGSSSVTNGYVDPFTITSLRVHDNVLGLPAPRTNATTALLKVGPWGRLDVKSLSVGLLTTDGGYYWDTLYELTATSELSIGDIVDPLGKIRLWRYTPTAPVPQVYTPSRHTFGSLEYAESLRVKGGYNGTMLGLQSSNDLFSIGVSLNSLNIRRGDPVSGGTGTNVISFLQYDNNTAALQFGGPSGRNNPDIVSISAPLGSGTDTQAKALYVNSGQGTGAGAVTNSAIYFRTPTAGASGSSLQSMTIRAKIDGDAATANESALSINIGGSTLGRIVRDPVSGVLYTGTYTAPGGADPNAITNAVAGANVTITRTNQTITVSASSGGGATNGTSVGVDGSGALAEVNFGDSADTEAGISGTNASFLLTATGVTSGSYTNPTITVDSKGRLTFATNGTAGGGSGTEVSVDGALQSAVNLADGSEIAGTLGGSDWTYAIVANSLGTNKLTTAAWSSIVNRTNHYGTQNWTTIHSTPTTRSGYGITDAQPGSLVLTNVAALTGGTSTNFLAGDGTFKQVTTNMIPGLNGMLASMTNSGGGPSQTDLLQRYGGATFKLTADPTNFVPGSITLYGSVTNVEITGFGSSTYPVNMRMDFASARSTNYFVLFDHEGLQDSEGYVCYVTEGGRLDDSVAFDIQNNASSVGYGGGYWVTAMVVDFVSAGGIGDGISALGVSGVTNLVASPSGTWAKTNGTAAFTVNNWTRTIERFTAAQMQPPAANNARFLTRNSIGILRFDPTTQQSANFVFSIPDSYAGSTVTIILHSASSVTSGNYRFGAQIARLTGVDIDSDTYDTAVEATTATSGTAGLVTTLTLSAVGLDSAVAGDFVQLNVYRDTGDGADTVNSNDMELIGVEVRAE